MTALSAKELREKSEAELNDMLAESLKTQFKYRLQKASQSFNSVHLMGIERKNVAKIKTILREKQAQNERA